MSYKMMSFQPSLRLIFCLSFALSFSFLIGQPKFTPPSQEISDPELKQFLEALEQAIKRKDKEFILENMSSNMMNSFGGDGGIE
ncbi:MAG: hypothetical protein AAGC85_07650, partial [Bacteroidota bacterium]